MIPVQIGSLTYLDSLCGGSPGYVDCQSPRLAKSSRFIDLAARFYRVISGTHGSLCLIDFLGPRLALGSRFSLAMARFWPAISECPGSLAFYDSQVTRLA